MYKSILQTDKTDKTSILQTELRYSPWGVGLISAPIKNQAGQTNNDTLLIPDLQKRSNY